MLWVAFGAASGTYIARDNRGVQRHLGSQCGSQGLSALSNLFPKAARHPLLKWMAGNFCCPRHSSVLSCTTTSHHALHIRQSRIRRAGEINLAPGKQRQLCIWTGWRPKLTASKAQMANHVPAICGQTVQVKSQNSSRCITAPCPEIPLGSYGTYNYCILEGPWVKRVQGTKHTQWAVIASFMARIVQPDLWGCLAAAGSSCKCRT